MFHAPFSVILAIIAFGIYMAIVFEAEAYRRRRNNQQLSAFNYYLTVISQVVAFFKNVRRAEESMACQESCLAPARELMDEIKELINFHRPCLTFPLNDYWWELATADYATGRLSATLKFPEGNPADKGSWYTAELVWIFEQNLKNQTIVRLEWHSHALFQTKYKLNILLSMAAYTEERIRKLNLAIETALSNAPALSASSAAAALSAYPAESVKLLRGKSPAVTVWPSPQDYNEAVQNPSICFVDNDLSSCDAELNQLGMPKAVSGSFASVYRMCGEDRDWAVRCFLSPVKDQQQRYALLSKHLAAQSCTSIIDFKFVESGIKVRDKLFPILKMEWIDGDPLHIYVEKNLKDTEKLAVLRSGFQEMVSGLRAARIAHGDLQHGNILVRDDKLLLVDYDGMFIPELVRFQSAELGHPNYQHPRRDGKHFGLFLDNFAGWLIDTTLLCLEEDPSLWDKFSGGDECLLFRRTDLISPHKSKLFNYLGEHSSVRVQESISHFISLLKLELEEIPFLEAELGSKIDPARDN